MSTSTFLITSTEEMTAFGNKLANAIPFHTKKPTIIFLYGELGTGKTTLTRGFLQGLGYQGKVKSPTYALVEPYEINHHTVYHFDFYRLTDPHTLEQIGIQDYFATPTICLIEWPDNGVGYLPTPDLSCHLEIAGEHRTLRLVTTMSLVLT
ncbi:MAG TPA: tRNA (adenosine(37)-N6)-threonylcarbamoyltransferase complex ATPase subunit type 1 TsaE [Gammaproteobacteria bacterium]|jgi:tRNA threonylcarbamoyladenosine biosynthesis protein TsaE|nr:tRNA (adenosine(37)-N6)-threonylcarbamoyltransferase complex ATPase subunit type 1 TsaE [Gammaproteobacteria bacterium]